MTTPAVLSGAEWVAERARLLAEELVTLGVRRGFVVTSVHNVHFLKQLAALGIECVPVRTELGCAHAADACARASGEAVLAITSTGPGAGNAVGGFATAAKDGSPVIHVTAANLPGGGQINGTHTVLDQEFWLRSFEAPVIDFAHAEPGELTRAVRRGGAVTVVIPVTKDGTGTTLNWSHQPELAEPASREQLDAALRRWTGVPRRMLWIGGGSRAAGTERLVEFAEATGSAVVTSYQAKDLFPADHPQYVGSGWTARARRATGSADACLALGTRFTEVTTRTWAAPFPPTLVRVGRTGGVAGFADVEEINVAAEVVDALAAAQALVEGSEATDFGLAAGAGARAEGAQVDRDRLEYRLMDAIEAVLAPGDVFVGDMTIMSFWAACALDFKPGVRFLWPGLLGIGYGVPAGLGAAVGRPDSNVVVLTGDGSLITTLTELDPAVTAGARFTVVLVDDDGYGMLRPHLGEALAPRYAGFGGPDWGSLAAGFGVEYVDAGKDMGALRSALAERPRGVRLVRVDGTEVTKDFLSI